MKNENAIMDRIKARIAYHANEHRHTYEIGKGVMDFLARDLLADFKAAGGLLPPVAHVVSVNQGRKAGVGPFYEFYTIVAVAALCLVLDVLNMTAFLTRKVIFPLRKV